MLSACLSKQASRALLRRRFARSTKENDSSSVYDSSATEMFRHNRLSAGKDLPMHDIASLQSRAPLMRPKKRFDEISAVHFSSPATSSFRDSHEKRKSKSDGNELVDVHVDGSSRTKPDSPFTRIINLDQGYDQSQASSKSLNSKEKTSPNSKWLAVAGLGLGMILVFVSFTEGSVSQHAITTSTGGESITNLLPSWLHQSSPTSSEKS